MKELLFYGSGVVAFLLFFYFMIVDTKTYNDIK